MAELQPKAQQKQKHKEYNAKYHRERKDAAARVAVLEALKERGPLSDEQEVELAELGRRRSSGRKRRNIKRSMTGRERLLSIVLRCWRSWRSRGR
ncbi:hypothetical protein [Saccharopolyspora spinosa]|uniref:hypothetical protein n=1 Tax=Saccharopolyspora spinosa TaxID=60894 RepID=UPI00376EF675